MKKAPVRLTAAALACALLFCSGCSDGIRRNAREIARIAPVLALGLDDVRGGVALSVCAGSDALRLTGSGSSVTRAMEAVQAASLRDEIYYPHTGYILLGEDAAWDCTRWLDYIERNQDIRLDALLFTVQGEASELVEEAGGSESDVAKILDALESDARRKGSAVTLSCSETARELAENGAALLCALTPCEDGGTLTAREDGAAVVTVSGLAGYIPPETLWAARLFTGRAGETDITLPGGVVVTVTDASAKARPISDEHGTILGVSADVSLRAVIAETESGMPITGEAELEALETALEKLTESRVRAAVEESLRLEADYLGLRRRFALACPGCAVPEELSSLAVSVDVNAQLRQGRERPWSADS